MCSSLVCTIIVIFATEADYSYNSNLNFAVYYSSHCSIEMKQLTKTDSVKDFKT